MSRRTRLARASAALLAAALLAGCSGFSGGNKGYIEGDGAVAVVPDGGRGEPVVLSGTTMQGENLDLNDLRGSVVVVNVWYASCKPCRNEAPDLQKAATELAGSGVKFLGLNIRDDPETALAFERTFAITYPSLRDGGPKLTALRGGLAPGAVPSTVVLDRQGRIAAGISGETTRSTLVGIVQDVLKTGAA
jgi:thiol-disulfide isomerase/thioredoxin